MPTEHGLCLLKVKKSKTLRQIGDEVKFCWKRWIYKTIGAIARELLVWNMNLEVWRKNKQIYIAPHLSF